MGGEEFREEMLGLMEEQLGENHAADLKRENAAAKAERIIAEELARLGWTEADLANRRNNCL